MQSSNPVFNRTPGFNGQRGQASGVSYPAYDAGTPGYAPEAPQYGVDTNYAPPQAQQPMTIDSVVQRTAFTLGLVIVSASIVWAVIGEIGDGRGAVNEANLQQAYMFAMGGAIVGLVLALVNSFKKVISPPLVMAYAVVEGAFVGGFSKIIATWVGPDGFEVVLQAVLGTFMAFAATLFAYKFFNIQVTDKFRRVFTIALMGFVGLLLANFVYSLFTGEPGLRTMGPLGLLIGVVALVFGVISLIMDFDMIEKGIEARLPERESWRAAFGLTVTLIWIYIELLRILAILRGQE